MHCELLPTPGVHFREPLGSVVDYRPSGDHTRFTRNQITSSRRTPRIVRGQSCVPWMSPAGTDAHLRQGQRHFQHTAIKEVRDQKVFTCRQTEKHVTLGT